MSKPINRRKIQNDAVLSLATRDDMMLAPEVRQVMEERNMKHAFALEMNRDHALCMALYEHLKKNYRVVRDDYLLGENDTAHKKTAYFAPMHDTVMAMTETSFVTGEEEKAIRDVLLRISDRSSHEH